MKPILENVLFRPFKGSEQSEGGIFVPESCQTPSDKGLVVAVGNGSARKEMKRKVGEVAYRVHGWAAAEVLIDGQLHYLMNQDAIIAVQ